jgi:hypothetical protein
MAQRNLLCGRGGHGHVASISPGRGCANGICSPSRRAGHAPITAPGP